MSYHAELALDIESTPPDAPDPSDTYQQGHLDGQRDARVLLQPRGPNGAHSFERYQAINATYRRAIFTVRPTAWQQGYGAGFDEVAAAAGYTGAECDEDNL